MTRKLVGLLSAKSCSKHVAQAATLNVSPIPSPSSAQLQLICDVVHHSFCWIGCYRVLILLPPLQRYTTTSCRAETWSRNAHELLGSMLVPTSGFGMSDSIVCRTNSMGLDVRCHSPDRTYWLLPNHPLFRSPSASIATHSQDGLARRCYGHDVVDLSSCGIHKRL